MALIGTIAINMKVHTEQMVRSMKKAAGAVSDFGAGAARSVGHFGGMMADAGRATAGVVDQFYVRPFLKAARFIGGVSKEVGTSLGWAGKGMAGPLGKAGGMLAGVGGAAKGLAFSLAQVGASGAVATFKALAFTTTKMASGLRAGVNALGGMQARIAALAAGGLLYKVAQSASALAEQSNRAGVMFGDATGEVVAQSKLMAGAFGISRTEFLKSTSAMAGMFQGIGYAKKDSADLSVHFLKLATDLGSIAQIPVAEALEKIESGLAGEVRPLRDVGVFMSEAAIKAKAAQMGIARLGTELTEQQKVQARVAFITEKLSYAQGDLARTADSAENATRGFMGRVQDLMATIGEALLPVVGAAMAQLSVGVQALSTAWSAWTASVVADQSAVVGAVGETTGSMGFLQKAVGFVADEFQTLKMGFYLVQSYITSGIAALVRSFGKFGELIDYVVSKVSGKNLGIGEFLNTYSDDLDKLSEKQYATYQENLMKAPASEGINAAFAAAQSRIKAMRGEAMKPGVDVTKLTPKAEGPTKAAEPKFASAMEAGSKEAANTILRSRFGDAAAKGPAEETAKNTRETNRLLGQIAVNLGGGLGAMAGNALAANM